MHLPLRTEPIIFGIPGEKSIPVDAKLGGSRTYHGMYDGQLAFKRHKADHTSGIKPHFKDIITLDFKGVDYGESAVCIAKLYAVGSGLLTFKVDRRDPRFRCTSIPQGKA